jgi:hypothetical protein
MSSPLPPNMAMTTVRGRYGTWSRDAVPLFVPIVGMQVRFAPAYPFVTNTSATPTPLVIATNPRTFQTDASGYLSDPDAGFDNSGNGLSRNCLVISSDDPDINPHDWQYLVTFHGPGATNFRAFRTPAQSDVTVDIAVLTPQRVPAGTAPSQAEVAAASAAASAASAAAAAASIRLGQAGGAARLDADGDVTDADGVKVLPGGSGGSGGTPDLSNITGMSTIGKSIVATLIAGSPASASAIRGIIGAGTGNSNVVVGTTAGTAADAALTTTALNARPLDTAVVHKAGDELISGAKNFIDPLTVAPAVANGHAVNLAQMNGAISAIGGSNASPVIADFLDSTTAADARTAIGAASGAPNWGTIVGIPSTFAPIIGTTATTAKAGNWVPTQDDIVGLTDLLTSLAQRLDALESIGANAVVITGASSLRNNPETGIALSTDSRVIWVVEGAQPVNSLPGDLTLNKALV